MNSYLGQKHFSFYTIPKIQTMKYWAPSLASVSEQSTASGGAHTLGTGAGKHNGQWKLLLLVTRHAIILLLPSHNPPIIQSSHQFGQFVRKPGIHFLKWNCKGWRSNVCGLHLGNVFRLNLTSISLYLPSQFVFLSHHNIESSQRQWRDWTLMWAFAEFRFL